MEKITKTIIDMIKKRGYKIVFKNPEKIIGERQDGKVIFFKKIEEKFNKDTLEEYLTYLQDEKISSGIVVYNTTVTSIATKLLLKMKDINIDLFHYKEVMYNITENELVPLHCGLTKEKSLDFIKKFGNKLPILLVSDPVSRFYGFKKKTVVKIVRNDGSTSYRIVR